MKNYMGRQVYFCQGHTSFSIRKAPRFKIVWNITSLILVGYQLFITEDSRTGERCFNSVCIEQDDRISGAGYIYKNTKIDICTYIAQYNFEKLFPICVQTTVNLDTSVDTVRWIDSFGSSFREKNIQERSIRWKFNRHNKSMKKQINPIESSIDHDTWSVWQMVVLCAPSL